ncbi:EAL domain-containing protein [Rhizobium acidisoli]|uniref:EAL domain-containing protein n=1 Tax=Rhizobium acidisoli TaxID=1538158 RepID=A0AAE5WMJ0_9HYPH|nr:MULTISPECIES: EAL domain-containing protein [Rhizobium]MBB5662716.1 EAL domain-containing protein (putative c-di-GMP-specific phosphodiesterase class I) [Rhizobium leguminosarum]QAS78440.1 EAL domain-containing protein [Rhizobium acidisoli]
MLPSVDRDVTSAEAAGRRGFLPDEAARLKRLRELASVSAGPDPVLDALVNAACLAAGTPIGLITLLDSERQWFKSKQGIEGDGSLRADAFCDHTIRSSRPFVVPDALRDVRFADNPFVTGSEGIRFYAGVPLEIEPGLRLGSLCVLDRVPRRLGIGVRGLLDRLARCAVERLLQSEDRYLLSRIDAGRLVRAKADKAALALAEEALVQGFFMLHYQPKLALYTGRRIGFEALLRLRKPDGSILGPSAFSAAFDEPRLSRRIGSHVLQCAVAQAKAWEADRFDFGHIAINVSSSQFMKVPGNPCLVDEILAATQSAGLSPGRFQIEVTEGVMLSEQGNDIATQLAALRAAGFIVAFDDFGTGFASLVHLKELAYDEIKIDGSFVRAMIGSSADHAIVKAMIDMAKALGKEVVAEGVETMAELQALKALGCHYGQGFLFGRPISASYMEFPAD